MLVANSEAPMTGHVSCRPARKKPSLVSLAWAREARRSPMKNAPTQTEQTGDNPVK